MLYLREIDTSWSPVCFQGSKSVDVLDNFYRKIDARANVVRTKFVQANFPNFVRSNMSVHIFWIQLFTIFRLSPGDKHIIGAFFSYFVSSFLSPPPPPPPHVPPHMVEVIKVMLFLRDCFCTFRILFFFFKHPLI